MASVEAVMDENNGTSATIRTEIVLPSGTDIYQYGGYNLYITVNGVPTL